MKKFGLLVIGGIAAIVLLANLGPMAGLAIGLAILYFAFKKFTGAETTGKKVLWGAIGVLALCASISNLPAILGVVAIYVLYVVYKKWNDHAISEPAVSDDPFTNFERQWAELKKN
ncbi:flagellar basal body rod protein [Fictibacillus aquaticus]|uniref:Flagellar basal body rod protein n=1 Tax=Fictibacillus aquaticus TaxID=2021314 RepID=A0A235F7V8_9BACL|nr:flagellar basal body rod protein [Fictibacillus aquaticus]OYD57289.1 flagellar basal body rod protein [Fictibacillus aquaticus]